MNLTEAAKTLKSPGDCIYRPDWGEDYVRRNETITGEEMFYYDAKTEISSLWNPSFSDLIAEDYKNGDYQL